LAATPWRPVRWCFRRVIEVSSLATQRPEGSRVSAVHPDVHSATCVRDRP
jgi:hypothetical protein